MNQQKRTQHIDLNRMRKSFSLKPIAIGVTSIFLAACGSQRQDAVVYSDVQDCVNENPDAVQQCTFAYEEALREAARTAPKYNSEYDCEYEFGNNQCRELQTQSGSFFMPFMAGYMVANILSPRPYYQPMFTSYSRYSPYRYHWIGADGYDFGDSKRKRLKVRDSAFDKKPAVTRTISRGGFGSSVRAKSNWGSKSSKGWGG
jgi:uncharacterized protein YgiB involved in biofilm formation